MTLCFPTLNGNYFTGYINQINSAQTAAELQEITNEVFGAIGLLNSCLTSQLSLMGPLEVVLTPPTALANVISWISSLIAYLEEQAAPYVKATAQLTALVSETAALTAAVESAIARIKPSVTIVIPGVGASCSLSGSIPTPPTPPPPTIAPGSYVNANITIDSNGLITAVTSGSSGGGVSSSVAWGGITGTLSSQTDLQAALNGKASSAITLTAGAGLTGGGDLSANRTFTVGQGTGIVVNATNVALDVESPLNVDHSAVVLTAGAGLTGGGDITASRAFALTATGVTAGSYSNANITVDGYGRLVAATNGSIPATAWGSITGTLSSQTDLQAALTARALTSTTVTAGTGLTGGGDLSANRSFALSATAVTPGSYTLASLTVDAFGRVTAASNGANPAITALTGDVTATGPGFAAATLAATAVTPGSYTYASLSVDSKGRLTAASSGVTPVAATTSTNLAIAKFNGTAGQIQNSGILIDASNNVTGANSFQMGTGLTTAPNLGIGTIATTWPSASSTLFEITESATALNAGTHRGLMMTITGAGTAISSSGLFGLSFDIRWASTGTVSGVTGIVGLVRNTGAGVVTAATGISSKIRNDSTGTITTAVATDVISPTNAGGGTIATNIGLRIGAMTGTGITTGWAFQSTGASDNSYFAGQLRLGSTTVPTNPLSVTGKADFTGTIKLPVYTVATLPTASPSGQVAFISDALAPAYLAVVAGGGASFAMVFSDGTNWRTG